jgi:hypothetical protein
VHAVRRVADGVLVTAGDDAPRRFDAAVIATHPDQALLMLAEPTAAERSVLGAIPYSTNHAQLHTDVSVLPRRPRARASWNYRVPPGADAGADVLVTYDVSRLMRLSGPRRFMVTLGGRDLVDPASVVAEMIEGTRVVMGDPVMRILVLLSTAFNLAFTGPVVVGLPWLVQVRFGGDAALLGLLFAAFGGGSLVGILLAGAFQRSRGLGGIVLVVATFLGVGIAAIGLASAPVVGVILLLIGGGVGYLNVSIITWTQARTEPHLLGRTMSFLMLGSVVGAPLSLAVAGAVVDAEATALFVGAGALIIATALAGFATSLPRRMV